MSNKKADKAKKDAPAKTSNSKKTTSSKTAHAASKILQDGRTGKNSKTAAGSALSQKVTRKRNKGNNHEEGTDHTGPRHKK